MRRGATLTTELVNLDRLLGAWIAGHRIHALDPAMQALSTAGRGEMIWLALGLYFLLRRLITRAHLAALALSIVVAVSAADYSIKPIVNRPRPFVADPEMQVLGNKPKDASFPSSHSANAFAAAYVFSQALPSARVA